MDIHYNAFISYRHHPDDIRVASEIHRSLEHYKVPRAIRKKTKGITRLFRDKEELPITSDLSSDITKALRNSEYLIVICSTHTCESTWVQREIDLFLQTHDRSKILTVLVDGEPYDTIPEILRYEERVNPATGLAEKIPIEPLSCDWRVGRRKAKREELPRLAAALLGCGYDELRQRERQYRTRRMVTAFSAALAVSLCFTAYFIYTSLKIQRANEQLQDANIRIQANLDQALENQSKYLSSASEELLDDGDRLTAMRLALEALPEYDGERPYVASAELALSDAVGAYQANTEIMADGAFNCNALISIFQLTDDGSLIYIVDDRDIVTIWDTKTFEQLASYDLGYTVYRHAATASGNFLAAGLTDNILKCISPEGNLLWSVADCNSMAFLDDKSILMIYKRERSELDWYQQISTIYFLDPDTGKEVREPLEITDPSGNDGYVYFTQQAYDSAFPVTLSFSFTSGYNVGALDLETGECALLTTDKYMVDCSTITADGNILVMSLIDNGILTGSFYNSLLIGQADSVIQCFDRQTAKLLWETTVTSYSSGDCTTLQTIPGSTNILCQEGNVFHILDCTTGVILVKCETTSIPLWVKVGETNATAILRDGSICTFSYETKTCSTTKYLKEELVQADSNHGIFVKSFLSSQIIVYHSRCDENWQEFSGDYDLTIRDSAAYGNLLAIESYSFLCMFDAEQKTLLWQEEVGNTLDSKLLGFTPDGSKLLALRDSNTPLVYDPLTGESEELPLPLKANGYTLSFPKNFRLSNNKLLYTVKNYDTEELYVFCLDLVTNEEQHWKLCKEVEPETDDWFYQQTIPLASNGEHALVWENSSAAVYQLDFGNREVRTILTDVSARPIMQIVGDGGLIALALDNRVQLRTWDGETVLEFSLGDKSAAAFCMHENELLVLCNDGDFYRFDESGKQLSQTALMVYHTFYSDITGNDYDPNQITWTFTDDGTLILNLFDAGNIIDCSSWQRRAFVPHCITYIETQDAFATSRNDTSPYGIGTYHRYTTEELMQMAEEALGSFELTNDQKAAYGLLDDE